MSSTSRSRYGLCGYFSKKALAYTMDLVATASS